MRRVLTNLKACLCAVKHLQPLDCVLDSHTKSLLPGPCLLEGMDLPKQSLVYSLPGIEHPDKDFILLQFLGNHKDIDMVSYADAVLDGVFGKVLY